MVIVRSKINACSLSDIPQSSLHEQRSSQLTSCTEDHIPLFPVNFLLLKMKIKSPHSEGFLFSQSLTSKDIANIPRKMRIFKHINPSPSPKPCEHIPSPRYLRMSKNERDSNIFSLAQATPE